MAPERELQNNLLPKHLSDRRSFLKLLSAAPLFASLGARSFASAVVASATPTVSADTFSNNIYTRLGVRPVINCVGTWTYLTASLELPEVRAACEAASHYFVDLFELQAAAGRRLAQMSGAESGMVTSGSAGAISAATAACIAGSDPKKIYQLPDTTGMKGEVVFLGPRTPWDSCIRLAGAKLVVVPTVNDVAAALTSQTAMVYTRWGDDERLQAILKVTKPAGVPVFLDQAGHIPPYSNFTRLAKTGVDLFCFSGGKGLRGPQVSGVLLGRKDLIDAALYNCSPWEGSICRPMKVGKEEIMGVLAAIDYWSRPEAGVIEGTWQRQMERIAKMVSTVPGVQTEIGTPPSEKGNSYPTLTISWDAKKFGLTANQCGKELREGNPRIDVWTGFNFSGVLAREQLDKLYDADVTGPNQLQLFSVTLQSGQDLIVGNRIRQVLEKARKQVSA
jgi:L-seryl-tRNA(Ser) seleniumtransferase